MSIDLIIMFGYFIVVLAVGLIMSRKVKNVADFTTGSRSYSAPLIFATLTAAYIGGGFTTGLTEKVFTTGVIYIIAMWGFSLKEILVATIIAPRMSAFKDAVSVGDIMGKLYGRQAKIFTGGASALVCAGIAGAQFGAFGYMIQALTNIPPMIGVLLAAGVVIIYSSLGGMKAVVANDVLHFCVLIISLPLVLIFGVIYIGGIEGMVSKIPTTSAGLFDKISIFAAIGLFLNFFFGETLVPPYVQRLLIGKTLAQTARGTLWSGIVSIAFFPIVGCIGLVALHIQPDLNPHLSLPFVINTVLPIGLKGLAMAGMMAVIMSSADAFLNSAGTAITQDIIKPLKTNYFSPAMELKVSRLASFGVGVTAVVFSISIESVLDILLYAYNFWTPFILTPLIAGILGYRASSRTFWFSAMAGISAVLIWNIYFHHLVAIDGAIIGICANFVVFVSLFWAEKHQVALGAVK